MASRDDNWTGETISAALCAAFTALAVAVTLELISGMIIIPRVWWLGIASQPAACLFCKDAESFDVSKAYDLWEQSEQRRWKACVASLPSKSPTESERLPCDSPYLADFHQFGSHLYKAKSN